jgi:flagellar basal-body rod protein FlgF
MNRKGAVVLKGLRTAETAMNIQLTRTNALANNLANVNTTGFKRMLTQVVEESSQNATPQGPELGNENRLQIPGDRILNVRAPIDDTQGTLRETGAPLDLAITGDGMFKIRSNGQEFYTRNGSFSLNENRQLVTSGGDLVMGSGGPIALPNGEIMVRRDGTILVDDAEVTQIAMVKFDDIGSLNHVGNSLMAAPQGVAAQPMPAESVEIAQGMLENSNVNPIDTLVGMIAAQRAFEMQSKVLQAEDRTLDKAINQLSSKA